MEVIHGTFGARGTPIELSIIDSPSAIVGHWCVASPISTLASRVTDTVLGAGSYPPTASPRSCVGNHGLVSKRSAGLARLFRIRIVKVLHGLIGVDLHAQ